MKGEAALRQIIFMLIFASICNSAAILIVGVAVLAAR